MTYRIPATILGLAIDHIDGLRHARPALWQVGGRQLDRKPDAND